VPVVVLQAALAFRKSDERAIRSGQRDLFDDDAPKPELRAVQVNANEAARRQAVFIPKNMRVPTESVIFQAFQENVEHSRWSSDENLGCWSTSDGDSLRKCPVHVEAVRVRDRAWAIILLTENPVAQAA
jgi:hypothetical protein